MTDVVLRGPVDPNPADVRLSDGTFSGTAQIVGAGGIASAEAFGLDTFIDHVPVVGAGGIPSAEAFGADTFIDHVAVVDAGGIVSAEAFGQPTVTAVGVPQQQQPSGGRRHPRLPDYLAPKKYEPFVMPLWVSVKGAGGIESAEAFGLPTVSSRRRAARRRREEEVLLAA